MRYSQIWQNKELPMLFITRLCLPLFTAWVVLSFPTPSPVCSEQRKPANPSAVRVLSFPDDFSVGKVYIMKADWRPEYPFSTARPIVAKGKIVINGEVPLTLDFNPERTITPEQITNIPAKEFVCLRLDRKPFDDNIIKLVNQFRCVWRLELNRQYITDKGLLMLGPLENLQAFRCDYCSIRGPGLASLAKYRKLRQLIVSYGTIDSNQLGSLATLQSVRDLSMRGAKLDDTALSNIGKMMSLERLNISGSPKVTDAGLKHLTRLRHLRYIDLAGCKVTANGLLVLKGLPLRQVDVLNVQVSAKDVERLRKDFPRVNIQLIKPQDKTDLIKLFAPLR